MPGQEKGVTPTLDPESDGHLTHDDNTPHLASHQEPTGRKLLIVLGAQLSLFP